MQQIVVKNTAGAIQFAFVGEHIHWNHVFKFFLHGIAGNTGH